MGTMMLRLLHSPQTTQTAQIAKTANTSLAVPRHELAERHCLDGSEDNVRLPLNAELPNLRTMLPPKSDIVRQQRGLTKNAT